MEFYQRLRVYLNGYWRSLEVKLEYATGPGVPTPTDAQFAALGTAVVGAYTALYAPAAVEAQELIDRGTYERVVEAP